jgi:hypothetical protein
MNARLRNMLARLAGHITPNLESLVIDLDPGEIQADLDYGRDEDEPGSRPGAKPAEALH